MMIYIWLALFVITLSVEIIVPALVSLWFAAGSLAALILAFIFGDALIWLQVLAFIVVSVLTIVLLRPVLSKNDKETQTNVDSLIGEVGVVQTKIEKYNPGTVKIRGLVWTAELSDEDKELIDIDSLVSIEKVKGNTLVVKKFEEENK